MGWQHMALWTTSSLVHSVVWRQFPEPMQVSRHGTKADMLEAFAQLFAELGEQGWQAVGEFEGRLLLKRELA